MEEWKQILRESLSTPKAIAGRFGIDLNDVEKIYNQFKVRINPYYASLIKGKDDPLYKQMVPNIAELDMSDGTADPLAEDEDSPVPGIVHRYPDRVLFLVSAICASYCRFCTRKRKVGNESKIKSADIASGIDYIKNHEEIRDVIISGGDPLMLNDDKLESILAKIREIPHIQILRIGSRVPCVLPQRVTQNLVDMIKKYHPVYMNLHFNHPDEITEESKRALNMLANAGIPLGSQTVLLKGVNDNSEVMKLLMQKLLMARVKPYYIYQADYVKGTLHFRTKVEKGLEIIRALRGFTSGLAVPHFVIDAPGGGGKIPLLPEYVLSISDDKVVMKNYEGKIFTYYQP